MGHRKIIGAMSGTSADGVDVALIEVAGRALEMRCQVLHHLQIPYSPGLRKRIFSMRSSGETSLRDLAELARDITRVYADAVLTLLGETGDTAADISAIGAHGQTLFHDPPMTLQWLDPALLARETNINVVSDFRRPDCAIGGQGAPLVPFADYILFSHSTVSRVCLNLGGIANLTWLGAGLPIDRIIALDTGPANCLSDYLVRTYAPDGLGFDPGGTTAFGGRIIEPVLRQVLAEPWFAKPPPKSTDGPEMIQLFERAMAGCQAKDSPLPDQLATACAIASGAVKLAVERWIASPVDELIVSGGGIENRAIAAGLSGIALRLLRVDSLGIASEAKEAVAFALLATATLDRVPGNVPSATGAKRQVVLGSITPAS